MNFNPNVGGGAKEVAQDKIQEEFNWQGGSCVQLDALIKKVRDKSVSESLLPTTDNSYRDALIGHKSLLEEIFASENCADKIETLRQRETGVLITKTSVEQEKSVLGNSKKEENIYIGVGALVLLVGLFIVIKK
jgi:hypothetical protein